MNLNKIFNRERIIIAITLCILFILISPASGAPASPTDKYNIVFDQAISEPHNYSTSFQPKIWLYNQSNLPVSGATVLYNYDNVNTGSSVGSGTATNNGDGSYTGGSINMQSYANNYINIKFSTTQNSNTILEQQVIYAKSMEASKGAVWKIVPFNSSYGPSWDRTQVQKVYMTLYSDGGVPMQNAQSSPTITIRDSTGSAIVDGVAMTYEEDGVYNYTLAAGTMTSNGEYYFEITTSWSSATATGGKNKYTTAITGFNMEAVGGQGDQAKPDFHDILQIPNFPTVNDTVTINADVLDNRQISSVTIYYSVNNGTEQSTSMTSSGSSHTYTAQLSRYLLEDHVRFRISASDGINSQNSSNGDYIVSEGPGAPNASYSYLNSPVYYFGYSRAGIANDEGGDTNYDGTWTASEDDGVYYLQANPAIYNFFRNMTTIKIRTLILDPKGKPVRNLTNVKAWLKANNTQTANATNANKTMNEVSGEVGVYTTTWFGSPAMSGTTVTWNNDARVMWGKYNSGQMYSVYVDFNNDSVADENVTWLAYAFGDTFWGLSPEADRLFSHIGEDVTNCNKNCHSDMIDSTSRTASEPTCPDCHGVEKTANGGVWPISGSTSATDNILYGNSSSHPRLNTSGNKTYCGDEACHNIAWGTQPTDPAPIPGYMSGVSIDTLFNTSYYPNPNHCGECHNFKNGTVPAISGHNQMVKCKYCHGESHRHRNLTDYSATVKDDVSRGTPGYVGSGGQNGSGSYAGDCYKDCHKVQVQHSLTSMAGGATVNQIVPCDDCHQRFNTAPVHQDDLEPYDDRNQCGDCHQTVGTITTHNTSLSIDPPRIPLPLLHSQEIGNKWNRTGTRPYWVEGGSQCRYCHGRSYNHEYGLGRVRDFMGNNVLNGTINSTSFWCASCHVQTYSSGSHTYNNMVVTYNNSMGVVPPEITGNTTWMSNRPNYTDHQTKNYINKSNSNSFPDSRCAQCHGMAAAPANITPFMHNVSVGETIDVTISNVPVDFGNVASGSSNNPAQGAVNITIQNTTSVNVNLTLKGLDFSSGSNNFSVGNLKYSNLSAGTMTNMTTSFTSPPYSNWVNMPKNLTTNRSVYFWISIPAGQNSGTYSSNVSVRVEQFI